MEKALLWLAPALFLACSSNITDPVEAAGPFAADSGTVLLADFNRDTVNNVTGISGSLHGGGFAPALFGSGVRMQEGATGKYGVDFPNTEAFSLQSGIQGSLEALVWADSTQPGSEYSTNYDLVVGNSGSDQYDVPFKGLIDAARVSRSIRTPAEIAAVWTGIAKRIR